MKKTVLSVFRPNNERVDFYGNFNPIYNCYYGFNDNQEYYDTIKSLVVKAKEDSFTHFFEDGIPFVITPEIQQLQSSIISEIENADIFSLDASEPLIIMYNDGNLNTKFLKALSDTMKKASIQNKSIRNSLLAKLVTWYFLYIKNLPLSSATANKIVYVGELNKHEALFFELLHLMDMDVILIDKDANVSDEVKKYSSAAFIESGKQSWNVSLEEVLNKGVYVNEVVTVLNSFQDEFESALYTDDSGVYKPWQFKNGLTNPLLLNGTLIDLKHNWNEEARLRVGFGVHDNTVTVPHFFMEIEGVDDDYNELLKELASSDEAIVIHTQLYEDSFKLSTIDKQDLLKLVFFMKNDKIADNFKDNPFYKYEPLNDQTEDFILKKIESTFNDLDKFFAKKLSDEDKLRALVMWQNLPSAIVDAIDSFDFPFKIPKLIVYCDPDSSICEELALNLLFLTSVGFDIVVMSPEGRSNLSTYIKPIIFNSVRLSRLEKRYYDIDGIDNGSSKKSKGFFASLSSLFS